MTGVLLWLSDIAVIFGCGALRWPLRRRLRQNGTDRATFRLPPKNSKVKKILIFVF